MAGFLGGSLRFFAAHNQLVGLLGPTVTASVYAELVCVLLGFCLGEHVQASQRMRSKP